MIFTWLTRTSQIQAFKPLNIFRPVTINGNQFLMSLIIKLNIQVCMFTAVDIINKNISRFFHLIFAYRSVLSCDKKHIWYSRENACDTDV